MALSLARPQGAGRWSTRARFLIPLHSQPSKASALQLLLPFALGAPAAPCVRRRRARLVSPPTLAWRAASKRACSACRAPADTVPETPATREGMAPAERAAAACICVQPRKRTCAGRCRTPGRHCAPAQDRVARSDAAGAEAWRACGCSSGAGPIACAHTSHAHALPLPRSFLAAPRVFCPHAQPTPG